MFGLKHVLAMASPVRLMTMAAITSILLAQPSHQQTYSTCNPTQQGGCPADPALGRSVSHDFRQGAYDQFDIRGTAQYGNDGATLTVAKSGDSPTLISKWFIMFGRVDVVMKAAPGAGIVSSAVLQSNDLDEIDWEFVGAESGQVQSNYFSKGAQSGYGRAAVTAVSDVVGTFHKYTIDWTPEQIVWQVDGKTVRVLTAKDAGAQYPQTPMQIKLGVWAGGDPATNEAGTVEWAKGPTNYAAGPFNMVVQSVAIMDYSTGTSYTYGDTSGTWQSIQSSGGKINGNPDGSLSNVAAPAITQTTNGARPFDGTHADCETCSTPGLGNWGPKTIGQQTAAFTTYPGLPSGWTVSSSGKVVPPSAGSMLDVPIRVVCAVATCLIAGFMFHIRI